MVLEQVATLESALLVAMPALAVVELPKAGLLLEAPMPEVLAPTMAVELG